MNLFNTRKLSLLIWCIFLLSVILNPVRSQDEDAEAEEEGGEDEPPVTCQKALLGLVQGMIRSALTCLGGKLRLRSPFELATRFYCVVKCILSVEGILTEDGVLDEVPALFYFQEKIPESIRDSVIGGAQPCLEMAKAFNPKEYYCQSYADFTQCAVPVFLTTLGPYALECFGTPAVGLLFGIIGAIVPRATPAAEASNELRKRMINRNQQTYRIGKSKNNGTATLPTQSKQRASYNYNSTLRYPTRRNNFGNQRQF